MEHGNSVLVQKECNVKEKVFAARNLEDCLPSLPLKTRKHKKENHFFMPTILCFPEYTADEEN
jgi:hypothetical protein